MGPRFESVKAHQWPVGQAAKTAASHAANVGSIPARVTTYFLLKEKVSKENFNKSPLDMRENNRIMNLLLRRTVRRRKFTEVSFAYFSFQRKVSRC